MSQSKPGSQAQIDLNQRIAGTAEDADRVAEALRLLPLVLLRHDARVQAEYRTWRDRAERYEDAGDFTEAAAMRFLFESSAQLNALARQLKLGAYQTWLPKMLLYEFQRHLEDAPRVEVSFPADVTWRDRGRAPKHGDTHHEDLERSITWFYRHQVKQPADSKYALQKEYIETRRREGVTITAAKRQIDNGLMRAEQLLACIDAPLPDFPAHK